MKKISIFSAIIGLLIYGCSSNEEVYNNYHKEGDKSFRVTVEQPVFNETRAQLDNAYNVVFEDKDEIAVFEDNKVSKYVYSGDIFVEDQSGDGSTLEGEALDGIYALYPYSAAKTHNSGTLPAKQTYRENSFSNESQIMYGQTDNIENGFNLKNMCGYIRLHLYGENVFVKDITLSVTGEGEYVSGDFYIDTNGDEPSLKMYGKDETHTSQSQSTTLVCSNKKGVALEGETVFYIALPPQTYTEGFTVTITDIFGREFTKTASTSLELKRNHIKPMEALEVAFGADELVIVKGTDEKQYAKVKTLDQLLKWGYTLNNVNKDLGMILEDDIVMPNKIITVDNEKKTYEFTVEEITISNGIPSGSNWIPIVSTVAKESDGYNGNIDGKKSETENYTIENLIINNENYTGLVGFMYDNGSIKNLNIKNATIKGKNKATGAAAGRAQHGTLIENVHVINSTISGGREVGGIVGRNYRRKKHGEELAYIINCSTDADTNVKGTDDYIGGICGKNYGAVIIKCENNAGVTGSSNVGGIAGRSRSYDVNGANGYVIASVSTNNATISSTSSGGFAGGIVGDLFLDVTHKNAGSQSYIIACSSNSALSSDNAGTIVGTAFYNYIGKIISSWAEKKADNIVGEELTVDKEFSDHYVNASDITPEIVGQMNQAIAAYNNTTGVEQKCPYIWKKENDNSWPVLELAPENAD